ncbi:alternative ribosome rescue aminoacyl-tRNA hydrolase ArfB [Algoriphagus pacificus]|uniref:Aminoacyl-tRNA hydrolase n=1 Tax=Algoriphagus pacificus TaxID=2811234 RepID=A0ABS3CJX8_9BACT|nr:alternative ribosome rescue aminoacyl-tRNA hydrolase ArfB [Algoriphagus pacificus]MBN7816466.1 aminoacyl-tRNA hydrolase [Algoriphagus pacificus]
MQKIRNRIENGDFLPELTFQTSRSSGPGGQNVNKVETKVQLSFDLKASQNLSEEEKEVLFKKLKNKITEEGILQVQSQEKRSQLQNKELAIKKFYGLIQKGLEKKKARKPTKPGKGAIEKRLKAKKSQAEKKANRGWKA